MLVSPAEPPPFNAIGEVSSLPEKFGADFLWAHNGKLIGVQRKEFRDLLASTGSNDRLARESQQLASCHIAALIIEGIPHWTTDGHLSDRYNYRWTKGQYRRLLMSVMAKGIWVLTSADAEETISILHDLEAWTSKGDHMALSRRPGARPDTWGTVGSREWKLWVLQGFPGMGPDRATALLEHFGGELPLKWTTDAKGLMAVKGIGKKLAQGLIDVLGG